MLDDFVCPMKHSTIPVVHSTIPFHYSIPLNVDTLHGVSPVVQSTDCIQPKIMCWKLQELHKNGIKACISYECIPPKFEILKFSAAPETHFKRYSHGGGGKINICGLDHSLLSPSIFIHQDHISRKLDALYTSENFGFVWEIGSSCASRKSWTGEVGRFAQRMMAVLGLGCRKALVGTI